MSLHLKADVVRPGGFHLAVETLMNTDRVTALFGQSGSGKSTILRLITGLEKLPNVTVRFFDDVWQDEKVFVPPHKRGIGYVFQGLNLFPHITAEANLQYAEARQHQKGGLSRQEIIDILDIGHLLEKHPGQLSGGEQQRVAIARALLSNPRLLVMDEPLGSIDAQARQRILPYLQRLHTRLETPVIYVSHSLEEVLYFCDTVVNIKDGRIIRESSVIDFSISDTAIQQSEAAAIAECIVEDVNPDDGLSQVSFATGSLLISTDRFTPGDRLRIKIPARDVSITRSRHDSSIINVIETTIQAIDDPGNGPSAMIRLACGDQFLLSRITRRSLYNLKLQVGEKVLAQIKGVALMTEYER